MRDRFSTRGRPGLDRLRRSRLVGIDSPHASRRRRGRVVGNGVRMAARRRTVTRRRSRCRDRRRRRPSPPPGATRATSPRRGSTSVAATTIAEAPVADADLVVVAVPSSAFESVVAGAAGRRARCSASPRGSIRRRVSGCRRSSRGGPWPCLSGPNFAEEIAAGLPAATVIASEDEALALRLQEAINSPTFRVYVEHRHRRASSSAARRRT